MAGKADLVSPGPGFESQPRDLQKSLNPGAPRFLAWNEGRPPARVRCRTFKQRTDFEWPPRTLLFQPRGQAGCGSSSPDAGEPVLCRASGTSGQEAGSLSCLRLLQPSRARGKGAGGESEAQGVSRCQSGVWPRRQEGASPGPRKRAAARTYVGLPASAPHLLLWRGPAGTGDIPPCSVGTVSAFLGLALAAHSVQVGPTHEGACRPLGASASPTTSRLPPLLSHAGGCAPEGVRRTETAQTLPGRLWGVSLALGQDLLHPPPSRALCRGGGGRSLWDPPASPRGLPGPVQSTDGLPAGSCPGPSAHGQPTVQMWGRVSTGLRAHAWGSGCLAKSPCGPVKCQ